MNWTFSNENFTRENSRPYASFNKKKPLNIPN